MPHLDHGQLLVAAALTLLMGWAALSDIRVRRIPNRCVLGVIGLFAAAAIVGAALPLWGALFAGLIGFVVAIGLYAFKIVGAGDAKLFAATALIIGLADLPRFALATVLAGGVMAAASIATRPTRALVMIQLRGRGDFGRGIPYGVAIAAGALFVVWTRLFGASLR